jgi:hypothetical protein
LTNFVTLGAKTRISGDERWIPIEPEIALNEEEPARAIALFDTVDFIKDKNALRNYFRLQLREFLLND